MKPINVTAVLISLIMNAALPIAAFNLLAPADWCWLPAGRAAIIGAVASGLVVVVALAERTAQNPTERPQGDSPANPPQND